MDDAKRSAREHARAARQGIDAAARSAASEGVARRVLALPQTTGVRSLLAFAAMPEELDPAPIAAGLRARGVKVAYPRVSGPGTLTLHWAGGGEMTPGAFGILEPAADAPQAAIEEIDLVLVPGCAFDASCRRLGMGGGFYDRLLARLRPDAMAVGVAFDEQLIARVPTDEHDVTLDAVVTPTRTLRAGR